MTAQATHIQPSIPPYSSSTEPFEHRDHADGDQHHRHLDRQDQPGQPHELEQRAAGQARLHEVPVTEQHRVRDHAEERRADQGAEHREPHRGAGVDARGHEAHHADRRGRRRRARAGTSRASRRRTADTAQRDPGGEHDPVAGGLAQRDRVEREAEHQGGERHGAEHAAEQPAVAGADLTAPGRDRTGTPGHRRPTAAGRWRRRAGSRGVSLHRRTEPAKPWSSTSRRDGADRPSRAEMDNSPIQRSTRCPRPRTGSSWCAPPGATWRRCTDCARGGTTTNGCGSPSDGPTRSRCSPTSRRSGPTSRPPATSGTSCATPFLAVTGPAAGAPRGDRVERRRRGGARSSSSAGSSAAVPSTSRCSIGSPARP